MDNVVKFPGTFSIGEDVVDPVLTVDNVLEGIKNNNIDEVFVVGLDGDGELYLASNVPSLAKFVYLLEMAKVRLVSNDFEYVG